MAAKAGDRTFNSCGFCPLRGSSGGGGLGCQQEAIGKSCPKRRLPGASVWPGQLRAAGPMGTVARGPGGGGAGSSKERQSLQQSPRDQGPREPQDGHQEVGWELPGPDSRSIPHTNQITEDNVGEKRGKPAANPGRGHQGGWESTVRVGSRARGQGGPGQGSKPPGRARDAPRPWELGGLEHASSCRGVRISGAGPR